VKQTGAEQRDEDSVRFVDAATVRRLTAMPRLIAALDEAFAELPEEEAIPRQAHSLSNGVSMLVMPAHRGPLAGVKVVTVNPQKRPAVTGTYLLIDGLSGDLRAIIDASMLTPRRTAAASALACDYLARPDASTLLMVGTGTLSHHLVEAHATVRSLQQVMVWGRDAGKADQVAAELRAQGYPAASVLDLDAATGQADIISVATLSTSALIRGSALRPGTHVDLVGAFTPHMCEADPECFARARVFVDTREGALTEAGDLLGAIESGAFSTAGIAGDLAELCSGHVKGRRDKDMITLFKSVGASIEDLVAAELIVQALDDAGA
jgi:ornithine cyclodeaminase